MVNNIKNYKQDGLVDSYNKSSNFSLKNSEFDKMIFDNDVDVYDSSASMLDNVSVLTSSFIGEISDLGATVKDSSSLESVVASTIIK